MLWMMDKDFFRGQYLGTLAVSCIMVMAFSGCIRHTENTRGMTREELAIIDLSSLHSGRFTGNQINNKDVAGKRFYVKPGAVTVEHFSGGLLLGNEFDASFKINIVVEKGKYYDVWVVVTGRRSIQLAQVFVRCDGNLVWDSMSDDNSLEPSIYIISSDKEINAKDELIEPLNNMDNGSDILILLSYEDISDTELFEIKRRISRYNEIALKYPDKLSPYFGMRTVGNVTQLIFGAMELDKTGVDRTKFEDVQKIMAHSNANEGRGYQDAHWVSIKEEGE